ncbi:MAG: urease subunit beta [Thaumarchaeota archaeon]|nr:urease subunit beta [Nitrososphaerota archaeon]NDF26328.1 urease subunit beta [Nitrosopumilaceae archaeon]
MIPGEYFISDKPIVANQDKKTITIQVKNTGDRPIQVGSHTHFFEANKALEFPRSDAYGFRLNIPSGTSVRFEPGEVKKIELTEYGGRKIVWGFSGLVNGKLDEKRSDAIQKAKKLGFRGA